MYWSKGVLVYEDRDAVPNGLLQRRKVLVDYFPPYLKHLQLRAGNRTD